MSGDHNMNQQPDEYKSQIERHRDSLTAALLQAQTAAISLAHKVKMYETALEEIAWSNNSTWQKHRAKHVLAQMRGVEL